ncbi:MAG: hypothetical protein ACE5JP_07665 [Candidatus Bipolaricaulia bacterium]
MESKIIQLFGGLNAKSTAFYGAIGVQVIILGLLGGLFTKIRHRIPGGRPWLQGLIFSGLPFVLLVGTSFLFLWRLSGVYFLSVIETADLEANGLAQMLGISLAASLGYGFILGILGGGWRWLRRGVPSS